MSFKVHMCLAFVLLIELGVTHNIPLLREVITHPRFVSGKISTKFLAEEFPGGFNGHSLTPGEKRDLLILTGFVHAQRDIRRHDWVNLPKHHPKSWDLVITIDKEEESHAVRVERNDVSGDILSKFANGDQSNVTAKWPVESSLIDAHIDGNKEVLAQYLHPLPLGFSLSFMGTKVSLNFPCEN